MSNLLEKIIKMYFFQFFGQFFPFLCPRVNHARRYLLSRSFLKSYMSESITSIFTKERKKVEFAQKNRINRSFARKK